MRAPCETNKSRKMSLPDGAVEFGCGATPGCLHGNYVCTARPESDECETGWAEDKKVPSRGACSRSCHFQKLCHSFQWDSWSGCRLCLGPPATDVHAWKFDGWAEKQALTPGHIVEWHHGWHSSPILSVWTGKIDLISEGYISPRPMGFSESHVLLPSRTPWVTYRFQGNNCLLIPNRQYPGARDGPSIRQWKTWETAPLLLLLLALAMTKIMRWIWQVYLCNVNVFVVDVSFDRFLFRMQSRCIRRCYSGRHQ